MVSCLDLTLPNCHLMVLLFEICSYLTMELQVDIRDLQCVSQRKIYVGCLRLTHVLLRNRFLRFISLICAQERHIVETPTLAIFQNRGSDDCAGN